MEPISRKQWIVLWALPVLFVLAVASGHTWQHTTIMVAAPKLADSKPVTIQRHMSTILTMSDSRASYIISEAGSSIVNGDYMETSPGIFKNLVSKKYWIQLSYNGAEEAWEFADQGDGPTTNIYYSARGNSGTVPTSNWKRRDGISPSPTVTKIFLESYTVSGFGKYDGLYKYDGVWNGINSYKKDSTHYLFWVDADLGESIVWGLHDHKVTGAEADQPGWTPYFYVFSTDTTPPETGWSDESGGTVKLTSKIKTTSPKEGTLLNEPTIIKQ